MTEQPESRMPSPAIVARRVERIGFVVADLERSAGACAALFALPTPETREGGAPDARYRSARLALDNCELEIFQPVAGRGALGAFLEESGRGGHHLAFAVEGVTGALTRLRRHGLATARDGTWEAADATALLGVQLRLLDDPERGASSEVDAAPLPPPPGLGTRTLRMIVLAVSDAERARAGFAGALGLEPPLIESSAELGIEGRLRGAAVPFEIRWARFRLASGPAIEFAEPVSGASTIGELLAARGPALHHLTFAVADVEAAAERLTELGFATVFTGAWPGGRFVRADARAVLGAYLEVVEPRR